ncbi:MAG: TraR/DksA family transcriptional regulator [Candidatus Babeliales bacterium]
MTEARKNSELEAIKKKLLERKSELERLLVDLYKNKENPGQVQDPGDLAQLLSQETLDISLQDTELEEYSMIRQALKMLEEGSYGLCIDCEQPISEKRLKSYPNATRCLVCQELFEDQKQEF